MPSMAILAAAVLSGGRVPFTPPSITGLQRWYQRPTSAIFTEEDGTGTVSADGAVGWLQDLSGNNEPAKQATEGDRPLYRAAHAVLANSLESVNSDFLKWDTALALNDFTYFCVASFDTLSATPQVLLGSNAGNGNFLSLTSTAFGFNAQNSTGTVAAVLATATKYVIAYVRSGTGANCISVYVNNVLAGQMTVTQQLQAIDQLFCRGAKASVLDGAFKSALLWNVALTAPQLTSVYTFLAA